MNYVITGAAGNISAPLTKQLLNEGHTVTIIGRDASRMSDLAAAGARLAVGSLEDADFLEDSFAGADAAYTMCPPIFTTRGLTAYYEGLGRNYAKAIASGGIKYVVNLSSVGAHLREGAGHIQGLQRVEALLNGLPRVNVRHIRPVFFYHNLFAAMDMIRFGGMVGNIFSIPSNRFPVVDPRDVADVVAGDLLQLGFTGSSVRYVASDETGTDALAAAIGRAIGMPSLRWTKFSNEQAFEGMLKAGFSRETALEFMEGFTALDTGRVWEDYWINRPPVLGKTKVSDFATFFGQAYGQPGAR